MSSGVNQHDARPAEAVLPLDYEERARQLLPAHVSAYYAAAAGSGSASAEGVADWSAVRFRPRALRDLRTLDTSTTVLGTPVTSPVLVAPMAQQLGAHPEGEVVMGRATAAAGSLLGVSTNSAVPFERVAATGTPWWFQVYVMRDRGLTELLVRRAVEHGARALMLTVDMVALLPADVNPRGWPEGPAKSRLTNLTPDELAAAGRGAVDMDAGIDFSTIAWLREISGLPVLVKGVLRGDDAVRAVDAGAAGVIVSTHGGRRLGPSITAARALPEVVAAVGGAVEVYADSGLRSAEHVAAALALGARAVFLGRPALWALAADGEQGVRSVLDGMAAELRLVMTQLGVPSVAEFTPDLVAPGARP